MKIALLGIAACLALTMIAAPSHADDNNKSKGHRHVHKMVRHSRRRHHASTPGSWMNHGSKNVNHWMNGTSKKINHDMKPR